MPRAARIDYPGALHHVITRGIERRYIFDAEDDKLFFLERLRHLLGLYHYRCYAWALMSNHVHILLQTTEHKLSNFMQRLLTSYAYYYNKKYNRVGYVFQNRYKSIVCDKDEYLLLLVRYIHLNPVKANLCTLSQLKRYPWCGHKELLGKSADLLTHVEEVLSLFGSHKREARQCYQRYMEEGLKTNDDYEGGGLRRSLGDLLYVPGEFANATTEIDKMHDQRVLGMGDFVHDVTNQLPEPAIIQSVSYEEIANAVGSYYGIELSDIARPRSVKCSEPRKVLIYLALKHCNHMNGVALGERLGIRKSGISWARKQGEEICLSSNLEMLILSEHLNCVREKR